MDVRAGMPGTPSDRARARWRATADRVWPIAMTDPDGYRRVADLVGRVLAELRRRATTVDGLLALDADPRTVLRVIPDGATSGVGGPRALFEAACAIRSDELDAATARVCRIRAIAAARQAGKVAGADPVCGSRAVSARGDGPRRGDRGSGDGAVGTGRLVRRPRAVVCRACAVADGDRGPP